MSPRQLQPTPPPGNGESWISRYEKIVRGYQFARRRGYLENPEFQQRVKNYFSLVRQGQSWNTAARESGISTAAVNKLIYLGTINDGSFSSPTKP